MSATKVNIAPKSTFEPRPEIPLNQKLIAAEINQIVDAINENADLLDDAYPNSNPSGFVDATGAANAAPVQSVNGVTGNVTLNASDVGAYPDTNPSSFLNDVGVKNLLGNFEIDGEVFNFRGQGLFIKGDLAFTIANLLEGSGIQIADNGNGTFTISSTVSGAEWGQITGTITNQTDLINLLSNYVLTSALGALAFLSQVNTAQIVDGAVTLAKIQNVPSKSWPARFSAGVGSLELQTTAQVKTELNLPNNTENEITALKSRLEDYSITFPENNTYRLNRVGENSTITEIQISLAVGTCTVQPRINGVAFGSAINVTTSNQTLTFNTGNTINANQVFDVVVTAASLDALDLFINVRFNRT